MSVAPRYKPGGPGMPGVWELPAQPILEDMVELTIPLSYPVQTSYARGEEPFVGSMPGTWERSTPLVAESAKVENVLEEALRCTGKERPGEYGHPLDHFSRTVGLINVLLGRKLKEPLTPEDWGLIMMADKLARFVHKGQRDSLVDVAGYARTIEMVRERLEEKK